MTTWSTAGKQRRVPAIHRISPSAEGRTKKSPTRVHQQIAEAVGLHPGEELVDIGCSDGTMLRIAESVGTKTAIGWLTTEEEVAVLRRFGLTTRQALTDRLPLPAASATVVVCNNVLLVVPLKQIPSSLREIHRIAKPGARLFLREIPCSPISEPTEPPTPCELSHMIRKLLFRAQRLQRIHRRSTASWEIAGGQC
jgi:ubiquinone/menaquinone biosynthesis C-methylase UbiE